MKSFFKSVKERLIGSSKPKNYPVVDLADDADSLLINSSCLHCPICYEVFGSAPDMLPCGHSFCSSCVGKLRLDAKYSSVFSGFVYECPFCREVCSVEESPMRNFAVEAVLESVADSAEPICPEDYLVMNLRFTNKRLMRRVTELEEQKRELTVKVEEHGRMLRYAFWIFSSVLIVLIAKLFQATSRL
ncbi:hypothetical protein QR680_001612 [Steinernema hermaphroditum]|uniref:RING-type domain-containing protein n=1 Tax=Steinernema hermaphroditum TaxID=289476 RepID=A0AA39GZ14_9BILA|nr:hypothetical protein QR680_001612 [Steinernema hermaphroditum]